MSIPRQYIVNHRETVQKDLNLTGDTALHLPAPFDEFPVGLAGLKSAYDRIDEIQPEFLALHPGRKELTALRSLMFELFHLRSGTSVGKLTFTSPAPTDAQEATNKLVVNVFIPTLVGGYIDVEADITWGASTVTSSVQANFAYADTDDRGRAAATREFANRLVLCSLYDHIELVLTRVQYSNPEPETREEPTSTETQDRELVSSGTAA